jgi:aminomuconate-semialdehyde/2-hydroxymuconate-6-semialdehyde dehydrogenase
MLDNEALTEHRLFIDGEYRSALSGRMFDKVSPVTGKVIAQVHEAGREDVDHAVRAAKAALNGPWGFMTVAERAGILQRVSQGINDRFEEFLAAEVADTGKPSSLARMVDIPRGGANFSTFADMIKNLGSEFFETDTPDGGKAINYGVHRPKGVIAVISPWNLPLLLMTWKVGPALALGNTVVVKPSEETPHTTTLLGQVMNDAGVPKGVYNVIHGFGPESAGEMLTQHPLVNGITFTGETTTGEAIMKQAAVGLRDISLELGGKNAAIIFADADLDKAVAGTMQSVFSNCGQVCLGTERVYVERAIFDEFVARLRRGAEAMVLGGPDHPGVNMGPLISAEHRKKVLSYYELAKQETATIVTGGGVPTFDDARDSGHFVEPTIWTGLPETSRLVREEIFGPCCHVSPFDSEDEVIAKVNDDDYGLASVIWTQDLSRAHRVAPKIEVGLVWVNSWFLRDLRTAFGGSKKSGIGREGGVHSLEFYSERANICVKL